MKLHDYIDDRVIIGYVWQFLNRCVEWGGLYQDIKRGILRGSSLSPLIGAFYLLELDRRMEKLGVKYFRYMDDILILAPTRWKLKKAIRLLNQTFNELKLEKHPDKTLIGRIEQDFDFLGYNFDLDGLSVAKKTVENFLARAIRLYEQEPGEALVPARLGAYVRRWQRWVRAGLAASVGYRPGAQLRAAGARQFQTPHSQLATSLSKRIVFGKFVYTLFVDDPPTIDCGHGPQISFILTGSSTAVLL